ncbi:MAG: hypothetical protein ACETVX_02040, partial [bacterium]
NVNVQKYLKELPRKHEIKKARKGDEKETIKPLKAQRNKDFCVLCEINFILYFRGFRVFVV